MPLFISSRQMSVKRRVTQLAIAMLLILFAFSMLLPTNIKGLLRERAANWTGVILTSAEKIKTHLLEYKDESYSPTHTENSPCFTVGFKSPTTGNGMGNHLFYFAGVIYAAWLTGRRPLILSSKSNLLETAFDLDIVHLDNSRRCPVGQFIHQFVYAYNGDIRSLTDVEANVSVWLRGSFCSWKYTRPVETELRRQLQFRRELTAFVEQFLSARVPRGWDADSFVRVGVHVRRGDFLKPWAVSSGFTVAGRDYLTTAMAYFVERYRRIQFVVASNDVTWCRRNIAPSSFDEDRISVVFSVGHSAAQDLALLASCDHTVMTTGTYSWWAAWLANGTTVYYRNFPKRGSRLWKRSNVDDYYPPWWIGL